MTALPNTIYVGADGKFETAPDTALIQFNISAQGDTAKEAMTGVQAGRSDAPGLAANGVDPKSAEIGFFPSIRNITGRT